MVAMGVAAAYTHIHLIEASSSKSMELKWVRTRITKTSQHNKNKKNLSTPLLPVYISTNPRHVDPQRLQDLCSTCNHSFQRFSGTPEPVDINKLSIALSHSDVLVSVFCKPNIVDELGKSSSSVVDFLTPVSPSRDLLVGFGRAVSDCGLTASIYDVMVIPSLRRMGIGKIIVKKIVRMLTNRDIYDIAALCSKDERLFFKACGFGGDILDSTTMMYTRAGSSTIQEGEQTVTRAGQKLLLIPPLIEKHYKSSRTKI
ncbi:GCN5-related N-acetyltransferase 3, chloroplastic-like [Vicia villosa]|uniref:GCN5-related N-acetyltransferase 3, chloroplastic-like n=1 Tax=Vicia villosa TaxID=3911 RepID=UPI00273B90B4|nr:GCN5-related N-acetyltransferase 3, chloroplastic-like [Vicia villosa]